MIGGSFAVAIIIGAVLPIAREGSGAAPWLDALFTSTSAVCVTGLVTVDTGSYWSPFGEGVILALIQIGGLGIMTLATLVALVISGRIGLRSRLTAQVETKSVSLRDVRRTIRNVVLFSLSFEAGAALILAVRFLTRGQDPGSAAYHGVFHSISAFNNAGFGLYPDNLVRYAGDPWVSVTVAAAVIVGGIGFPVVFELAARRRHPRSWSVLTRITLTVTAVLLVLGPLAFTILEWANPATLGPLSAPDKFLAGFFTGVMPRTAGFNSLDVAAMRSESWLVTDMLMFIGGGSAGTAGGIKVTTFGVLAFVVWAEMRGEPAVDVGRRRVPAATQRQALAVALLGVGLVVSSTLALMALSDVTLERALFETTSAFATVGLSTGITADLPSSGQMLLVALMYAGRVGPLTAFSALAARERVSRIEWPQERLPVG